MKAIEIKSAEFGQVVSRADGSVRFSVVTPELRPSESAALFPLHGKAVRILIEPNDVEPELTVIVDTELDRKTASQRLRSVLFLCWKQKPDGMTFNYWYEAKLEKLIEHFKKELP